MARPWQSNEEYQVDIALKNALSDPETIRSIRPLHPYELFPETRGFIKQTATIYDILDVNRYAASNRTMLSGMPVRRNFVDDQWEGASRYSMEALG